MSRISRYLWAAPLAVCLVVTTYNGLVEGYNAMHHAGTNGMKAATGFQLAYGVLGAIGLYVLARRPSWSRIAILSWAVAVAGEGLLAPIVYAGKGVLYGVAVAAAVAVLAGAAYWAWARSASRIA